MVATMEVILSQICGWLQPNTILQTTCEQNTDMQEEEYRN